jgi:hypothetical protein
MIYSGQVFIAVVGLCSSPIPSPSPPQVVSLFQSSCKQSVEVTEVTGGGAKSYEGEKAWSSINHSVGPEGNLL